MTAPTGTILDVLAIDTIAHLDFDPEMPCEIRHCQLRPPAAWVARHESVCGCRVWVLCCHPCRARIQSYYDQLSAMPGPFMCRRCKATVTSPASIRFTPLKEN